MARGLTLWIEMATGGHTRPMAVYYCRRSRLLPHEVEQVRSWVHDAYDKDGDHQAVIPKAVDTIDMGGWQVQKGIKHFRGLWWLWNPNLQVGALVGDNTSDTQLRSIVRQILQRRWDIAHLPEEEAE